MRKEKIACQRDSYTAWTMTLFVSAFTVIVIITSYIIIIIMIIPLKAMSSRPCITPIPGSPRSTTVCPTISILTTVQNIMALPMAFEIAILVTSNLNKLLIFVQFDKVFLSIVNLQSGYVVIFLSSSNFSLLKQSPLKHDLER